MGSINHNHLIWIDLEMTGLNPEHHRILEMATLITDVNLNVMAEGPVLAIHQSEAQLKLMNTWNIRTHTASGLLERVRNSTLNENIAAAQTLTFLQEWVPTGRSPMCGNSISQDRRFLYRYMPTLESYFNYRCLDVSTLQELARRWKPEIIAGIKKKNSHQALDDIRESVAELLYYRTYFLLI